MEDPNNQVSRNKRKVVHTNRGRPDAYQVLRHSQNLESIHRDLTRKANGNRRFSLDSDKIVIPSEVYEEINKEVTEFTEKKKPKKIETHHFEDEVKNESPPKHLVQKPKVKVRKTRRKSFDYYPVFQVLNPLPTKLGIEKTSNHRKTVIHYAENLFSQKSTVIKRPMTSESRAFDSVGPLLKLDNESYLLKKNYKVKVKQLRKSFMDSSKVTRNYLRQKEALGNSSSPWIYQKNSRNDIFKLPDPRSYFKYSN
mmetsp:Transcript_14208/g.20771  ORF Transcript_14208/g.20771 Transcript_14208/m.20771 type:complete len:253 (+) Transcript_14208:37-795(+)